MIAHMQQVGRVLLDGLRSAVLLRPRASAFDLNLPACVTLCLLCMGGMAALEYALSNGETWFNPQGLVAHTVALSALVVYVCALPFGRVGAASNRLFAGVVALATILLYSAALALLVTRAALPRLGELPLSQPAALLAVGAVFLFVLVVGMVRLGFGIAKRMRLLSGLGLVAAVALATLTFPNAPVVLSRETAPSEFSLLQSVVDWVRPPQQEAAEDEEPRPRIDAEAALTRQPELMAEALAKLQPPRADRPEYYFLAFAPYASQDVFKREVTAVKALFDERFGTTGRSLALINHRSTVLDTPLASMTNLNAALLRIGRLMRRDRDVLVLFVTSHGSKGQIAVHFPGFPLNGMTPDRLANALDRAGIVNRVLVLSACHSGSFVERLKSDSTLILAAAHADKTSFGCSNENEWTYFGDAYFNHALRTETSLIDAFATARNLIVGWEKKENLEPSEPQISVGGEIKAKLDAVMAAEGRPTQK